MKGFNLKKQAANFQYLKIDFIFIDVRMEILDQHASIIKSKECRLRYKSVKFHRRYVLIGRIPPNVRHTLFTFDF